MVYLQAPLILLKAPEVIELLDASTKTSLKLNSLVSSEADSATFPAPLSARDRAICLTTPIYKGSLKIYLK